MKICTDTHCSWRMNLSDLDDSPDFSSSAINRPFFFFFLTIHVPLKMNPLDFSSCITVMLELEFNISNIGWTALKFHPPHNFGDPLTFHLVPSSGRMFQPFTLVLDQVIDIPTDHFVFIINEKIN